MSSRFYLQPDTGKWSDLFADETAVGCILVDVNAAGRRYCMGTIDIVLNEVGSGRPLHFVDAIQNDPIHEESFDPFSRESSVQAMSFEVKGEHFPIRELRRSGVLLQDVQVDVYWYVANHEYSLDQALPLLSGKLVEPVYDEARNVSSFRVEDARLRGERPFPPVVATQDKIGGLLDEHSGKPYPVVIGVVKKLPLLDISNGSWDDFLVMQDRSNEWETPAQVSAIYDGDATGPPTENAEAQATDGDGNMYIHVTTLAGTSTRDVTADVTGHTPATPGETVRYLINSYGDDPDVFDLTSVDKLDLHMGNVTLGLAFNEQVRGGVLAAIRDRLGSVLPFGVVQRGGKYAFEPCVWDRDVVKHLRMGTNIYRKTANPTETKRSSLYNSFVVKYGRTGYRGDHTGCVLADPESDGSCSVSEERYGRTMPLEVDAGDLADEESARWLLNWLIETYSKTRVFVGYRCSLDAVNVRLLETVMVTDEEEWWDGVLFKVIGIRRGTGPWIDLDLVSVDDYSEVYQVNRPVISEVLTPAAGGPFGGHPTLGNDLVLYYAMHDNLSFPDPDRFVVVDSHTNGYDGESQTETGGMNDPGGIIGDCFNFNASLNDDVEIPDIRSHFTDEATLAIWLNLNNAPPLAATHTGLCRFSTSAYPSVTAYPFTDNNFYCAIFRNARLAGFSIAGGVDESTWHLLIVSTKPGANNYNIYQNLTNILSTTGLSQVYLEAACYLGRSNDPGAGSANFFDGLMGPAMVWSRELTAGERVDLYNGGAGLAY